MSRSKGVAPLEVRKIRIAASVHSRTQVHEPIRPGHEGGHEVRRQHVDGEDVRQAVDGLDAPGLSVPDAGVVDDRVVPAKDVGLLGDLSHARNARQIADDHGPRSRELAAGVVGPCVVAGMQRDFVGALDEEAGCHEAEAI
ncbi:MAG TPA: hypothetical protein VIY26_08165 [Acidimicrobiales bacterium]